MKRCPHMAIRGSAMIPSTVTKTLVCVDDNTAMEIAGTIHNPYMPTSVSFQGVSEMINAMDRFFNDISFPQAFYSDRIFSEPKTTKKQLDNPEREVQRYMTDDLFVNEQGKKATFVVQVQFRQNASWQGTITWNEKKKQQRFRSTLELIKLMNNALEEEEPETVNWE